MANTLSEETTRVIQDAVQAWPVLDPLLRAPRTDEEFTTLLAVIDYVADLIDSAEHHPLHNLLMLLSRFAWDYEQTHDPTA